jgi:aspartyl-tRNA(Asn)/glutamyl-tRNA(Gln) amidotransferase subunit A
LTQVRKLGLWEEVKRRILIGNYVLSSRNYEGSYIKAQKLRAKLKHEFDQIFNDVDCIIGPTVPCSAWKFGKNSDNPLQDYLSDIYTIPANLIGCPAISIPLWWVEEQGVKLPSGIQLMSKQKNENTLFYCAKIVQQFCSF